MSAESGTSFLERLSLSSAISNCEFSLEVNITENKPPTANRGYIAGYKK